MTSKLTALELKLLHEYALAESQCALRRYGNMKNVSFRSESKGKVFSEFEQRKMHQTMEFFKSMAGKISILLEQATIEERIERTGVVTITKNGEQK